MIMHGNQAGDAAFTMDQYMLSDGPQSAYGTAEFDAKIRAAEQLEGEARQDAFAELFAEEPQQIMQMAYLAHMRGILGKSPRVDYTPIRRPATRCAWPQCHPPPTGPTSPEKQEGPAHVLLRPAPDVHQRPPADHRPARGVPARPAHR